MIWLGDHKVSPICTFTHMYVLYVCVWHVSDPPPPSTSRPCDWPAAEGGCGNCCSICVHVYAGGDWLPSLSLPDGKRTEDSIYSGNANTQSLLHTLTNFCPYHHQL